MTLSVEVPACGALRAADGPLAAAVADGARQREAARREAVMRRYALQDVLVQVTGRDRLGACRRRRLGPDVTVLVGENGASFAGLVTCASIWCCPVCSAQIRAHRATEIQDAATAHVAAGGGLVFVTLTVPHGRTDKLRDTLSLVTKGWGWITTGKIARGRLARLDYLGNVRAVEITHGNNGWHPHIHLLLFTKGEVGAASLSDFESWLHSRWVKYCRLRGWGKAPSRSHGVDVQWCVSASGIARYVAKVQDEHGAGRVMGHELTRADLKRSRSKTSSTPMQLLERLGALPRLRSGETSKPWRRLAALWREYETETVGLSALRWSKGLRAALQLGAEVPDDVVVDELQNADAMPVLTVEGGDWRLVVAAGGRGRLRQLAETDGAQGAGDYVDELRRQDNDSYVDVLQRQQQALDWADTRCWADDDDGHDDDRPPEDELEPVDWEADPPSQAELLQQLMWDLAS